MKTKVIFKIEKDFDKNRKDTFIENHVFAFFPEETFAQDNKIKTSYAHIGQHSACHVDYADECKEAKYNEYADLLKELIGQGYNLDVLNNQEIELHREPTYHEINLGYGATHYRGFLIGEVLNKKGEIKKWIKASDDSLRYYY